MTKMRHNVSNEHYRVAPDESTPSDVYKTTITWSLEIVP